MSGRLQSIISGRGPIKTIGVVGMGYVGIPAAVLFANAPGFESVLGFQRASPSSGYKVAMLNRGESPLKGEEPDLEDLLGKVVAAGKFRCTSDFEEVAACDAVTLAIQTPFADPKDLIPDFSALTEGLRAVGRHLSEGTLVVIESTVTPGTTECMAREILEAESGLVAGEEFALAHAPERVMVGRLLRNIREHDRIVGGIDEVSTARAVELYRPVLTAGKIIAMTATAAEVTKTAENAFRDLQIAAANQLALHCEAMGVNVYDVRAGIDSLKGEGITRAILWPGAGVGGHCLTKDSWHLERGAQVLGGDLWYPHGAESIFGVARKLNEFMPEHMVYLTVEGLRRAGKPLAGATVTLLGWAFIQNSDDARNTPSEPYLAVMKEAGAEVRVHDPFVDQYPGIEVSHDLDETLVGADAVVVFTAHHHYASLDPARTKELSGREHPVIVDGRNVVDPDAFIRAGFVYKGIGRGDRNGHPIRE
ncbi:MAG: nucleotide sugar dehydrogenase [Methanoculleus sp.]|uniref:nucleotide sugar dehydrogenase n=1 Tax=unclassified Methanoculleus TaxID=2619537 RepID=UPI0025CD1C33|nr:MULTISPECIES: nucleotide sugar dehydrogenase [unclassified Methanoculleus]MCK9317854.1 nucleotide sugar dehydrogenase [Methanoculleus sp.]MDD2253078.1 nucleotide sugar dehydrogenase [Methanoculleus sp.]MDD3216038.1 nucleotide sugar dehydrogenase [Methanoculleus sp.]MDD4313282.1 nucleotide sugar dehydrogenase [Methanoculleus sp.]MDD4470925.1 nucleotide sugar dehydrogenase [Methanoculleus sp.]